MATVTLRPTGTRYNSGWTLSTGTTAHTLVDDEPADNATYVQAKPGAWLLVFEMGALTLPAYALITSVGVRVRRKGDGSARFDVGLQYEPTPGKFISQNLSTAEKPSSTIADKNYGSLVVAPGGADWDNDTIIPNLQVVVAAADTDVRVYEVYVDVEYDEAPTCVVTSPVGEITGTQIPSVEFFYADTEGSALERARVKIFTAAQYNATGFVPDISTAFWDSGEVLTTSPSVPVTVPIPNGDYHVYARVSDAGSGGRFGPWASAEFTMGGELPAAPTLSVTTDSDNRRHVLTVTQNDNLLSYTQSTMDAEDGEGDGWHPDNNTAITSISSTSPTATTLAETFTGANGALAAGNTDINWTVVKGSFAVSSNQLTSSDSGTILPSAIRTDSTLPSTDHYAQVVVNALATNADRSAGVVLRMASSGYAGIVVELNQRFNAAGSATAAGRFAVWEAVTSTTGRKVSGFRDLPKPLVLPATWKAAVSGDQVYVYIKMSGDTSFTFLGQWTTTITTGTQVGITLYNAGSTALVDTFEAGDQEPVVSGSSGAWLGEVTVTAARQGRLFSGSRYGWGTPVTAGEPLTVVSAAWQNANAARSCRTDVEYFTADDEPLTNVVFSETWTGANNDNWDSDWTSTHAGAADDSIQNNRGRLTTGAVAYNAPAREYASGMTAIADCEVLVLAIPSSTTAEMRGIIGLRTDGTYSGVNPGHPAAGYFVEIDPQNDNIYVREAGSVGVLATVALTIPIQGVYIRFRVHGTSILVKGWDATVQEPAQWSWIGEDSTWTAAGKLTLTAQNGADAVSRYWDFDDLKIDDLSYCNFGTAFTTNTDGSLKENSRNIVVPAGAVSANVILVMFPTGGSEVFTWDRVGVMPGHNRDWSRGGLVTTNLYGPNASSFEESAATTAGWAAGTDASIARDTYAAPPSGAALELSWSGSSGFPAAVYAYGPAVPATAGLDYAIRAWVWRIDALTALLRVGMRFLDASNSELAVSLGTDVLPTVGLEWADATHAVEAPAGTASVQAVLAATAVTTGAAAITRVMLVEGSEAPTVYQPGPAAPAYALCEYTDDGGITWERVRGTTSAYYGSDRTIDVYDHEAPPGQARRYRVSTAAVDYYVDSSGGATVVSEPSAEASATLTNSGFWLRDPLVPARLLEITIAGDLEEASREPQESHDPLGRATPVIVSDVVKGAEFALPLVFKTAEDYEMFEELRSSGGPLLFQGDFSRQWFVKLSDTRRSVLKSSIVRAVTPVRFVEIGAVEVDRPDPSEDNSGIVTGVVWETV